MRFFTLFLILILFNFSQCASNRYAAKMNRINTLLENGNDNQANTEIRELIAAYPQESQPYFLLGTLYFIKGNYLECLANFDKAERYEFQGNRDYYVTKGIALYHTGNIEEAESNLQRSMTIGSTPLAEKYLGIMNYESGNYSDAVNYLTKASSHIEDDSVMLSCLGIALYKEGRNTESLNVFTKALSLAPENDDIIFHTAHLFTLEGQYHEAVKLFPKIHPESPLVDESTYNLSEAYIRLGDYVTAVTILKQYIEKHPDDYPALYNLAAALIKLKNYLSAADILSTLFQRDKQDIKVA